MPHILDFLFDEDNLDKIAAHHVRDWQILDVLSDPERVIVPSRRRRRAQFLVIGHDRGGRCITIPVESTGNPEIWRPVTAWFCKPSEAARVR